MAIPSPARSTRVDRRPVHVLAPSFLDVGVGRGGINFFRGVALAVRALGPTTLYEIAPHAEAHAARWKPDRLEVRTFPTRADLVAALRRRLTANALVLKFSGALRLEDWEADEEITDACDRIGAQSVYLDGDGPSRLPYMVNNDNPYLGSTLRAYSALVLFAGGTRAVHEYRALTGSRVHHASPAICGIPLLCPEATRQRAHMAPRDFDLVTTVSAHSERELRLAAMLRRWAEQPHPPKVAVVGNWPASSEPSAGVTEFSARDPLLLQTLYQRSRFAINLLRAEFHGYSHTAAARLFEAALAGSCVVSEWFPGLTAYLEPAAECLLIDDPADVTSILALPEERRRTLAHNARTRVAAACREAGQELVRLLSAL